jgi:hypothetical protein
MKAILKINISNGYGSACYTCAECGRELVEISPIRMQHPRFDAGFFKDKAIKNCRFVGMVVGFPTVELHEYSYSDPVFP